MVHLTKRTVSFILSCTQNVTTCPWQCPLRFKTFRGRHLLVEYIFFFFTRSTLAIAVWRTAPSATNQIPFPAANASSFWIFISFNLGRCRAWVGFIQTRCYIVPWCRAPPPKSPTAQSIGNGAALCRTDTATRGDAGRRDARWRSVNLLQSPCADVIPTAMMFMEIYAQMSPLIEICVGITSLPGITKWTFMSET